MASNAPAADAGLLQDLSSRAQETVSLLGTTYSKIFEVKDHIDYEASDAQPVAGAAIILSDDHPTHFSYYPIRRLETGPDVQASYISQHSAPLKRTMEQIRKTAIFANEQDSGKNWTAVTRAHEAFASLVKELDAKETAKPRPADDVPFESEDKMTEISREELNAKLAASEARMDVRVTEVLGRIDSMIASQEGLVNTLRARQDGLDRLYEQKFEHIEKQQTETLAGIKNLKSTFIVTAVSSSLAIVLGVGAFGATVLSNMVASFESGKNTMQSLNQVSNQLDQTAKRLSEVEQRLKNEAPAHSATPPPASATKE